MNKALKYAMATGSIYGVIEASGHALLQAQYPALPSGVAALEVDNTHEIFEGRDFTAWEVLAGRLQRKALP